jgi:hypothetical protein
MLANTTCAPRRSGANGGSKQRRRRNGNCASVFQSWFQSSPHSAWRPQTRAENAATCRPSLAVGQSSAMHNNLRRRRLVVGPTPRSRMKVHRVQRNMTVFARVLSRPLVVFGSRLGGCDVELRPNTLFTTLNAACLREISGHQVCVSITKLSSPLGCV